MTPDERRANLRTILDQHNEAVRAFHASGDAYDLAAVGINDAMAGLRDVMTGFEHTIRAMQEANHAQRQALDAIIAANSAALTLFSDEA
jgi:hypothetical protein